MKDNRGEENKQDKQSEIISLVDNGFLVETVYDKNFETSRFLVWDGDQANEVESYKSMLSDLQYKPLPSKNDLLKHNILKLPSGASDYGSEEDLNRDIVQYLHKYTDISPEFEVVTLAYIKMSWLYDKLYELGYLRVVGGYGVGKSRYLNVVGSVCYKAIISGQMSDASIYRLIDQIKGTLVVDESDRNNTDKTSDFVKILNNGFQKGFPIMRTKPKNDGVDVFHCFGPKVIGMQGYFYDYALESRCITEYLESKEVREDIPKNLTKEFEKDSLELRNKLLMYRFKNYDKVLDLDKIKAEDVTPRIKQVFGPLLAFVPDDKIEVVLEYMKKASDEFKDEKANSLEAECLRALQKVFVQSGKLIIQQKKILEILNEGLDFRDKVSSKRLGFILRRKFMVKSVRESEGFVVEFLKNEKAIKKACTDYGVAYELDALGVNGFVENL